MRLPIPLTPWAIVVAVERRAWRPPRLTVRRLMIATAVAGLLFGGYARLLESERWVQYYRQVAARHGRWEADYDRLRRDALESGREDEARRYAALAARRRALMRGYEWSIWLPWRGRPNDPYLGWDDDPPAPPRPGDPSPSA